MKKFLKLVAVNLITCLFLLLIFELIFKANETFKFFIARKKEHFDFASPNPQETIEFIRKKYGPTATQVPEKYSSKSDYDWSINNNNNIPYHSGITIYESGYMNDYYNRPPNKTFNAKKHFVIEGKTISLYSVDYSFDNRGFRVGDGKASINPAKNNILAFGDSYTIGEGVRNNYDYPNQLNKKLGPDWAVFNAGFHGYGINDLLFELENKPEKYNFLKNDTTIATWLFIPGHLERAFCHLDCTRKALPAYIKNKPSYSLINDKIKYDGPLEEYPKPFRQLMKVLSYSSALNFFELDLPKNYSDQELKTFVQMFVSIKTNLAGQTHLKDFYFINLLYFPEKDQLLSELQRAGIKVIDYSDINFFDLTRYSRIPKEFHPTAEMNWYLSEFLKHDIQAQL